MIGRRLRHYRIIEKIGAGGMGEVYRAHDEHLNRDVAVKFLPTGTLADDQARRRFRKEAQALSKLNHPHIATVHDFDSQDGVDFIVMELVAGESLDGKLKSGPLSEKDISRLGEQMATALDEAHEQGIIHRDLKPANVRLTPKGQAKVLDFGIARLLQPVGVEATTQSFTEAHALAGTLPYMSPEQLRGEAIDERSDIYSLGVVLYEMATSQRPFQEKLSTTLSDAILHQPAPTPRSTNPRLSAELERIILKCLDKDPENRYQSARELAVDLRRLVAGTAGALLKPATAAAGWRRSALALGLVALPAAGIALLIALNVVGLRDRFFGRTAPSIRSLAVLPLENLSGDPEQDYFVEGMHEALTAELSKIRALKVISRTSTLPYKDTDKPLPQVARELKVDGIIEGSVLREGDQVRITVQLIHGPSDRHLWAQSFDHELRSILALQSDVARAIAMEVKARLTPEEETRLASVRNLDPQAHEAFLRGRYLLRRDNPEALSKAIEYLQRAIELEPSYAPAYATLAQAYDQTESFLPYNRFAERRDALKKCRQNMEKALELDPNLAEAHVLLANFHIWDFDWAEAEAALKRAVELDPNDADVRAAYANFLSDIRRYEEALVQARRAQVLDPLSPTPLVTAGYALYNAGRLDEAITEFQKALELEPSHAHAAAMLGHAYVAKGMRKEALAAWRRQHEILGNTELVELYSSLDFTAAMHKWQELAESPSPQIYSAPSIIAGNHAMLGEREEALEWLERAYRENDPWLPGHLGRLDFAFLRSDPRFQDLLRRTNFPN